MIKYITIFPILLAFQALSLTYQENKTLTNFAVQEVQYKPVNLNIPTHKEGFVCRAEDVVYKSSKIAVAFRLGNLQYVNQLDRN